MATGQPREASPRSTAVSELRKPYFWCWLTPRGREKITQYKYKGSDASIIYQNIFSPALNSLIEGGYVPRWLHPNAITLGGFGLVIFSYLLIASYSDDFSGSLPPWVCIVSALCLHAYQWLDALDGKQARHLGLGSPLGLLCDHGCDSLNASITAMNLCAVMQLGATWQAYFLWMMTVSGFFYNTWEEWFVGSLDLPVINGPNEGLFISCTGMLWTAYVGCEWWGTPAFYGLSKKEVVLAGFTAMALMTCLGNVIKTLAAVYDLSAFKKDGTDVQRQAATKAIALTRVIPFQVLVTSGLLWVLYSPTNVFERYPRLILLSLGCLSSKCCAGLMVAHLCDEPYRPFCKTISATAALGCYQIVHWYLSGTLANEDALVYTLAALGVFCICHAVIGLSGEISRLLGINLLVVPKNIRHPSKHK